MSQPASIARKGRCRQVWMLSRYQVSDNGTFDLKFSDRRSARLRCSSGDHCCLSPGVILIRPWQGPKPVVFRASHGRYGLIDPADQQTDLREGKNPADQSEEWSFTPQPFPVTGLRRGKILRSIHKPSNFLRVSTDNKLRVLPHSLTERLRKSGHGQLSKPFVLPHDVEFGRRISLLLSRAINGPAIRCPTKVVHQIHSREARNENPSHRLQRRFFSALCDTGLGYENPSLDFDFEPHHSSTAGEGWGRGSAAVVESWGKFLNDAGRAAINLEHARGLEARNWADAVRLRRQISDEYRQRTALSEAHQHARTTCQKGQSRSSPKAHRGTAFGQWENILAANPANARVCHAAQPSWTAFTSCVQFRAAAWAAKTARGFARKPTKC